MAAQPSLTTVAPAFVEMAHQIVWCTVATTDTAGNPRTRVLHPLWHFDGDELVGWIATGPDTLKARHLAQNDRVSLTYWADNHDTCSAECSTRWLTEPHERHEVWDRFVSAPEPVGYDPSIVPGWHDSNAPGFGVLELRPLRLRVMPGTVMLEGTGDLLTWPK